MKNLFAFLAVLAAFFLVASCDDGLKFENPYDKNNANAAESNDSGNGDAGETPSERNQGELYGDCYPNKTCNEGLICDDVNNICIKDQAAANDDDKTDTASGNDEDDKTDTVSGNDENDETDTVSDNDEDQADSSANDDDDKTDTVSDNDEDNENHTVPDNDEKECNPERCFKTRQCEGESSWGFGTVTGTATAHGTCSPTTGECICDAGWVTGTSDYGVGTSVDCTSLASLIETYHNVECAECDVNNPPAEYASTGCPAECPAMFCNNAISISTFSGSCYYEPTGSHRLYCECESGYIMIGSKYYDENSSGMCNSESGEGE